MFPSQTREHCSYVSIGNDYSHEFQESVFHYQTKEQFLCCSFLIPSESKEYKLSSVGGQPSIGTGFLTRNDKKTLYKLVLLSHFDTNKFKLARGKPFLSFNVLNQLEISSY